MKSDFIGIMASLVDFSPLLPGENNRGDEWRNVVASNVLCFKNNSRIHKGEHLCKWAVCHVMDPTSPTIFQSTVSFGTYKQ